MRMELITIQKQVNVLIFIRHTLSEEAKTFFGGGSSLPLSQLSQSPPSVSLAWTEVLV